MPTKWRIIHDLSWPAAHSVNDGIPKELFSCTYDALDRAISQLKLHGKGALMSKLDLSDAFRHILVRHEDWELLGSTWQIDINGTLTTVYFVDAFLPFELRSSPALFLKYVDILSFTMRDRGASPIWNYLDDFWTCGPPAPDPLCQTNLDLMLSTCADLGFNSNPAKTVVPCTTLELLGIELDSIAQEARISQTRLDETLNLLRMWQTKASCTKRQLQSLIGKLNFICSVCRPGRTFLRRMIELLSKGSPRAIISVLLSSSSKTSNGGCHFSLIGMVAVCSMMNSGSATRAYTCLLMPVPSPLEPYLAPLGSVQPLMKSVSPVVAP